jgi:GNAT superfamily N-acetyltransferase
MKVLESGSEAIEHIVQLLEESMGWFHAYYARSCIEVGICRALLAYEDGSVIGAILFYSVDLEPLPTTVIYYVVVGPRYRNKGVGKALVASVESVFDDERVFIATMRAGNMASRRMFAGLGYRETYIDSLSNDLAEFIEMLTCGYEDDVVMYKGIHTLEILARHPTNFGVVERVWRNVCYEPWRRLSRMR